MGKIKLIVIFLLILLGLPNIAHASSIKEAGASASMLTVVEQTTDIQQHIDTGLKRTVIQEILTSYNSPLVGEADTFIEVCTKYNIDCYLLPSITGVESTFGRFIMPGSHNPFGWGGGLITFDSWEDAIDTVGKGLSENYYAKGANTIETIAPIYAASPTWAQKIHYFRNRFVALEEEKRLYFSKLAVEL
jgi:hypothetical protein